MLKIIATGNVGRDPERTANGPVRFSVACTRRYKKASGEQVEETEWLRVTCWGKLGDIVEQHLTKGRLVAVEGRPRSSEYEKDGMKQRGWEVIAETVEFLGSKGEAKADVSDDAGTSESAPVPESGAKPQDDDIPF